MLLYQYQALNSLNIDLFVNILPPPAGFLRCRVSSKSEGSLDNGLFATLYNKKLPKFLKYLPCVMGKNIILIGQKSISKRWTLFIFQFVRGTCDSYFLGIFVAHVYCCLFRSIIDGNVDSIDTFI